MSSGVHRKSVQRRVGLCWLAVLLCLLAGMAAAPLVLAQQAPVPGEPPLAQAARRFLARRGILPRQQIVPRTAGAQRAALQLAPMSSTSSPWAALGPTAVESANFGLVTGRVTALALDPSDATGNKLFLGTTGGGVWVAQNAATANAATVVFMPLTDAVAALSGVADASISIGALTVQPGGTGVVLAGTGDVDDLLDSYFGAGILRSADGGKTWSLIPTTNDVAGGQGAVNYGFAGEGFAGFAWSTVNTNVVVAAVSEAYEGTVVGAQERGISYRGLFYSTDAGATWHLATILDGSSVVQGPLATLAQPNGNAATSVVWNPIRQLFEAAVRFHGYYQSSDGVIWTRMSSQPGANLTTANCPANLGSTGSTGCPIYRGTLAVNPNTGDTFAWTVDAANVDQGLWQDACSALSNSGACVSQTIGFSKQWSTAPLETSVAGSGAAIANGSYTLALAAVPENQDTVLLAGGNDLWRCSLAANCVWRNTTNTTTCMGAGVAPYQHAIAWSTANTAEIFLGNDSGLWRSMDAIGETGTVCSASDATHFQNLNSGLGSLADVEALAPIFATPYTLLAGLGVNGATGVKATTTTADWPQILGGYGGPVAIDATGVPVWYVNDQPGVSIYSCAQSGACTPADFGSSPVIASSNVGGDGSTMDLPAPFLVDPLDHTQLLIGTCRVWRGAASGAGWSAANLLSAVLDGGSSSGMCSGDALIGTLAALPLTASGEEIYVGMRGAADGGNTLAGHVLKAQLTLPTSGLLTWTDLTGGAVTNDSAAMNAYGMDISSIYPDPHDGAGNTLYVTVDGAQTVGERVDTLYQTRDGGATWTNLTANLPEVPANAVVVDPQDAGTVYVATDAGVYSTSNLPSCTAAPYACWAAYGNSLPLAPVIALQSSPVGSGSAVLVAATYGRGIWTTALATAGIALTTATALPATLSFGSQAVGSLSATQPVVVTNTGAQTLTPGSIGVSGPFTEQDSCQGNAFAAGASCTIQMAFAPVATGLQTGVLTIPANVAGGQLTVQLTGTGTPTGVVSLNPVELAFGSIAIGATAAAQSTALANNGGGTVVITSAATTAPFAISSDLCSNTALGPSSACQIKVTFTPTAPGPVTQTLTVVDSVGTQSVLLTGTGLSPATDTLSAASLAFPTTAVNTLSPVQTVSLTNSGGLPLKSIVIGVTSTPAGQFQESDNCNGQLAANSTCAISVAFSPTQTGALSGTLTVSDASRTQTVALTGQAVATPSFSVSPTSLTFTNQAIGVASAPQTVQVTNAGALPMANVGAQLTGAAAASYSLASNTCGATLAAGASCSVQVVFTPAGTGAIAALLSISSSTANVAAVGVPINGYGQTSGSFTVSPTALNFGAVTLGQSAAAQTATFVNGTGYPIAAPVLTVSSPFTLSQNTCAGTLLAGTTCSVAVNFTASAGGSYSGTLTANSSSVSQPLSVALTATVFDFAVALSGQGTQQVAAGQSASYAMTITAASGLTASYSYTYSCGALPANAACTFNPAAATTAASAAAYVVIGISTGKAASGSLQRGPATGWAKPVALAVLLLPLLRLRRRSALVLLLLAALIVTGCATAGLANAGGGGGGGSGATPSGTYTIPITVVSNGVAHSITVTLVVL